MACRQTVLAIAFLLAAHTAVAQEKPQTTTIPEIITAAPIDSIPTDSISDLSIDAMPDSTEYRTDTIPLIGIGGTDISLIDSTAVATETPLKVHTFTPDPNRAVWLSALFPGLGQVYNRRYWKLPIVVGGFMGIAYALDWNNRMLSDYTQAYRDIMDNDPTTRRYMDFFPSYVKEENLDQTWLQKILKSRKDFYRRNRDLSIICMAGMYFLCMLDAYVDASLSHFDISPDLSLDVSPTLMGTPRNNSRPAVGIYWAFSF